MFLNFRAAYAVALFAMCVTAQAQELIGAVWSGDIRSVETLLADGANINETTRNSWTPLMFAALRGEHEIAVTLIKSGANIDAASSETEYTFTEDGPSIIAGVTALMIAVIREDSDIVSLLLKEGANINVKAKTDYTALSLAIATDNTHIITQLLNQNPMVSGARGVKAIAEAVINRNEPVVKELLKRGIDANSVPAESTGCGLGLSTTYYFGSGDSLLMNAVKEDAKYDELSDETASRLRRESDKIVLHLLKNKADPNFQNMEGLTALMLATNQGRTRAMELLLEYGADPDIKGGVFGNTALMSTITFCNLNDMKLLIAYGADPNIQDNKGYTPLNYAQRLGCENIVSYLKSIGGEQPSSKNIFDAAKFGDLNKVQQFIREGADVNSIDKEGVPVLCWAIDSGKIDVIQELLEAGADVNTTFDVGLTPLMISVGRGRTDILRLLIKYGADIDAQNAYGGTAPTYAKELGAMEDLEVLRKAGAKFK